MKPKHIILVRHGQSEGNVNKAIYGEKPDYALNLTEKGVKQATKVGHDIFDFIEKESFTGEVMPVQFYVSPMWRTRQTYEHISKELIVHRYYEDPRLREQEWGHIKARYSPEFENERDAYGHFYYRFPDGESCADVFDRVSDFLQTLHRDFEKRDFAKNVVIVSHGMTMRVFLMRWFHLSVEEFELIKNPPNCGMYILKFEEELDEYQMVIPPERYEKRMHEYQFKWQKPKGFKILTGG